jgi:hypothetical protein
MAPKKSTKPALAAPHTYNVGDAVFIRTVTNYYTGKIVEVLPFGGYLLTDAAWIADTGRFAALFQTGRPSEVEPYPDNIGVEVRGGAILDVCAWDHPLPRSQV